jgi:hypothetical protein
MPIIPYLMAKSPNVMPLNTNKITLQKIKKKKLKEPSKNPFYPPHNIT